jgi:hypothetical protein
MSPNVPGILFALFALLATYGFLYLCNWLARRLDQDGPEDNYIPGRSCIPWRSGDANPGATAVKGTPQPTHLGS